MPNIIAGQYYCSACRNDQFVECHECNQYALRDEAYRINRIWYCPNCYINMQVCCNCGTATPQGRTVAGDFFCPSCYNQVFRICAECGRSVESYHLRQPPDCSGALCHDCFDDVCYRCDDCGESIWIDDAVHTDDGTYCRNCYRHAKREWDSKPFGCLSPSYDKIGSTRKFGVELETSDCYNHTDLYDNTIWGCKTDYSISGMEFVSPILYGDDGLEEIKDLCKAGRGWHVNSSCGYHAHLDITNEDWRSLRSIAYAYHKTYQLWCCFVSQYRRTNNMCASPNYDIETILDIHSAEDWDYFVARRDRFEFINWRAYLVHNTLEIRIHDASLDSEEICNWIKCHARFIDFVAGCSLNDVKDLLNCSIEQQFEVLTDIIGKELSDYYRSRAEQMGRPINLTSLESVV